MIDKKLHEKEQVGMHESDKKTEQSLRVEAVLAMALSFPDGLLVADRVDEVLFTNLKACDMLGHPASQLIGQPFQNALEEILLRTREPKQLYNLLLNTRPEQPVILDVSLVVPTPVGAEPMADVHARLVLFSVRDKDGAWLGRGLLMQDGRYEPPADQIKNEFMAVVSHELRTPLSAIQGFSELLLTQDAPPERQRMWLEMINRESVRLSGLIEDMLSLAHIESGRIDLRLERVDLEMVIRQVVEILRVGSSRHNFKIEIESNLPAARTDRDKLIQILNNIIGNAIKYSSKGGNITIRANVSPTNSELIQISISDQGVGIPEGDQTHIFEKYYRVRNGSTREVKGIGLGLAITRNLVELMGGRIWAESKLGVGTTFFFTVPVHIFPNREIKVFKDILLKSLLVQGKDITEAELYLDYLQRTLPSNQLDEVLRDTLYEVGELWHQGKIGIGDEHLAVGVIRDFLARAKTTASPSSGLRVMVGTVSGEEHIVGLTMVANAFTRSGWQTTNLGANVPVSAFITTIEQSKPDLLLLSISLRQHFVEIKRVVQEVRNAYPDLLIGVGGRLFNDLPDLAEQLGVDFQGTNPDETVRIATRFINGRIEAQKKLSEKNS
jgi:signal transduction histidine kinase/methanogenic corrinoid protein MtbC1